MADQNKLYLGTNKDTYIAADEAGNIVFQHEAGSRAVVDTEGIKFAAQGAELAPLGAGGDTAALVPKVTSGLFAAEFFNGPSATMRITNDGPDDAVALVFEFVKWGLDQGGWYTTMINTFGTPDGDIPMQEITLNEDILNYSAPLLNDGNEVATISLGNAATGDNPINLGLSPGAIITQNPYVLIEMSVGTEWVLAPSLLRATVYLNIPGNMLRYQFPPAIRVTTAPESLSNFESSDAITLETTQSYERLDITASKISMASLPTYPTQPGMLWNNNGTLRITNG